MTWDRIKRVLKIILGFILLPLGVVMLALPGPGWLTIVLALAILAGEFVWARKLLEAGSEETEAVGNAARSRASVAQNPSTDSV